MEIKQLFFTASLLVILSCSAPTRETTGEEKVEEKSLVTYVDLTDPLDEVMIREGTDIFTAKCDHCHTIDTAAFTVPAFAGITNRRSPEWIMNMIINVNEMLKQDPVAVELLLRHQKVMPDPELGVAEARAVVEFLRSNDLQQLGEKDQAAEK